MNPPTAIFVCPFTVVSSVWEGPKKHQESSSCLTAEMRSSPSSSSNLPAWESMDAFHLNNPLLAGFPKLIGTPESKAEPGRTPHTRADKSHPSFQGQLCPVVPAMAQVGVMLPQLLATFCPTGPRAQEMGQHLSHNSLHSESPTNCFSHLVSKPFFSHSMGVLARRH